MRVMLDALLNYLFGCTHEATTFPLTPNAKFPHTANQHRSMYIVCLKCGAEFAYDWERMRIGTTMPTYLLSPELKWAKLETGADQIG